MQHKQIRQLTVLAAVLTSMVAGCRSTAGVSPGGVTTAASAGVGTSVTPAVFTSAPVSRAPLPAGTFANPVVAADMPDPSILRVGNVFHLYTTQNDTSNIQTATSSDLVHWKPGPDALPKLGRWADTGKTWAPEVIAVGGRYVMFYTAADTATGKQCVGRAESTRADGPFQDSSAKPLICQSAMGGSIDPNPIAAAGQVYLYWKNDGNCCALPVHLWVQSMDATATTLTGRPTQLLGNSKLWQGSLIEAPEMIAHAGRYYLFYAANDYASTSYAEGYAVCTTPLGPCTDSDEPMLTSNAVAAGPGHAYIFQVGSRTWMIYHAWPPDAVGSETPGRQLWLDPVNWSPAGPTTTGPDGKPQAAPVS